MTMHRRSIHHDRLYSTSIMRVQVRRVLMIVQKMIVTSILLVQFGSFFPPFNNNIINNNNKNIFFHVSASQAAGTETLVGIVGKDFVLLGADSSVSQSISLTASNMDKIAPLSEPYHYEYNAVANDDDDDHIDDDDDDDDQNHNFFNPNQQQCILAAAAGDAADSDRLIGLLRAHATIQEYESGVGRDVDFVFETKEDENENDDNDNENNDEAEYDVMIHDNEQSFVQTLVESGLSVNDIASLARYQIASSLRSRTPYRVCLLIAGMTPVITLSNMANTETDTTTTTTTTTKKATTTTKATAKLPFVSHHVQQQLNAAWPPTSSKDVSNSGNGNDNDTTISESTSESTTSSSSSSSVTSLKPCLYWLDEYGSIQNIPYGVHGYASNFCLSILDQRYKPDMSLDDAISLLRDCFQQLRSRYVINSPQPPCIKCINKYGIHTIR